MKSLSIKSLVLTMLLTPLSHATLAGEEPSFAGAKSAIIAQMQNIENEMMKMQDQIDESSNGDSGGRLSAAGQMIDIVDNTIGDAMELDAVKDSQRLLEALKGVKELRAEVEAMTRK